MNTLFRALHPADAQLVPGDHITLGTGLAGSDDPARATGGFATNDLLAVVLPEPHDGSAGDDSTLRAGRYRVLGLRKMPHHLASAVDIEILVLGIAPADVPEEDAADAFGRAMMRVSLALACSGEGGLTVPEEYAGAVSR